jgi:HPr kinase/phosphorylase
MADRIFTVLDLIDLDLKEHNSLSLRVIGGRKGLSNPIEIPDLNRPMGAIMGFFEDFAYQRLQLFGRGEVAYLHRLEKNGETKAIEEMFIYKMPCCIFTHNNSPHKDFLEIAEKAQCPILQTELGSAEFSTRIMRILSVIFSPRKIVHGVLVEVYGLGILIQGDSGVGKSETALELIHRQHRLVADDVVEIYASGNTLMGTGANKIIGHHMEIRGPGIINITHLFGVRAIRDRKEIQLVVELEEWDQNKNYDRLGAEEHTVKLLGINIPSITIPVKPGRNIPIIIETAAMNERLKSMGYNAGKEFNKNILKWIESDSTRSVFFGQDDVI